MKLPRRRPSDDELTSWVETGRPSRVGKLLDDPEIVGRLEGLTALPDNDLAQLHAAVTPGSGFVERTEVGVKQRVSDLERVGTLFGLLGLGARTAQTLVTDDTDEPST